MAKIIIYEDSERDLVHRYSSLTTEHDVHVRHPPNPLTLTAAAPNWSRDRYIREYLQGNGFNLNNLQEYGNPRDESADVFFLDGLEGFCFELLPDLPREKSFVLSDLSCIRREAKERGYNVVEDKSVGEIVALVLARQNYLNKRENIRQVQRKALKGLRHPLRRDNLSDNTF